MPKQTREERKAARAEVQRRRVTLPETDRITLRVYCHHCVCALLQNDPTGAARGVADSCRGGRASCTYYANPPLRYREDSGLDPYCLECLADHKIDSSMEAVVIELQSSYQAAFGKDKESEEYKRYDAAKQACYVDGKIHEGLARPRTKRGSRDAAPAVDSAPASNNTYSDAYFSVGGGVHDQWV